MLEIGPSPRSCHIIYCTCTHAHTYTHVNTPYSSVRHLSRSNGDANGSASPGSKHVTTNGSASPGSKRGAQGGPPKRPPPPSEDSITKAKLDHMESEEDEEDSMFGNEPSYRGV